MGTIEILTVCALCGLFGFACGTFVADLRIKVYEDNVIEPFGYGMRKYRKVKR